ncbi:MAG: hypothetical protein OK457_08460 [Thaumarchaeota archaeon]|nr:hypothetical protein [Nitrososphaerota archaeon]
MINSSLVQEVVNATPSNVILTSFSQLSMVASTLNLGGIGVLEITANSTVALDRSGIVNASITLNNVGRLSANDSSFLNINGLNSTSLGSMTFDSSIVNLAPQSFTFVSGTTLVPVRERGLSYVTGNSTLQLNQAIFQASNSSHILLNTLHALVTNSRIIDKNVSNFSLGNSTLSTSQTILLNSLVQSSMTFNATIGSPAASSTTEISGSTVLISNVASQQVKIYGTSALTVFNSSITAQVGATIEAFGTLLLYGGVVSILRSTVVSSTYDYYGYSPISASNLIINSTLFFNIIASHLSAGQSSQRGIYQNSHLIMNSGANITIIGSTIQSQALSNDSIILRSSVPSTIIHNVTVSQSVFQTGPNPSNITFSCGYGLVINRTNVITNPNSTVTVNAYQLTSYDSVIPANITVGSSIAFAYLHNTTVASVKGLKTGIYQNYAWMFVHVITNSSTPVAGATVTLVNPTSGGIAYVSQTNSTGWAKISVLKAETNSTVSVNNTAYVVEAAQGSASSNQEYVSTNATSYPSLILNSGTANSALNYFSYAIQYSVGVPTAYMNIYTNAYPLNFLNNASNSELDFSTVGYGLNNYSFTLIYPANFTSAGLTIKVDHIPLKDIRVTSNASYYFATFSVPAGPHSIALSYISPNVSTPFPTNPILNPGISVVAVVVLLFVIGTVFILYYVRRQNISPRTS